MKKFKKENRVLAYSEENELFYLGEGYDVVEFNEETEQYDVVKSAIGGRTYSVAEYNKVAEELEKVKAELAELKNEAVEPEKTKAKKESKGDSK